MDVKPNLQTTLTVVVGFSSRHRSNSVHERISVSRSRGRYLFERLNLPWIWPEMKAAEDMSPRHLNRLQWILSKTVEYSPRNSLASRWREYHGSKDWEDPEFSAVEAPLLRQVALSDRTFKVNGLTENRKFKPGAYKAIEKLLKGFHPEAGVKVDPHCPDIEDQVYNDFVEKHPECANKNRVPFPNYDELRAIFGKGRATGSNVKQITDPAPEPSTDTVHEKNEFFVWETSPEEMIRAMEDNFVNDMLDTENVAAATSFTNVTGTRDIAAAEGRREFDVEDTMEALET
ncbi:Phospholipase A1-Ibeta2, chloroplastic [Linum perenne]